MYFSESPSLFDIAHLNNAIEFLVVKAAENKRKPTQQYSQASRHTSRALFRGNFRASRHEWRCNAICSFPQVPKLTMEGRKITGPVTHGL